MCRKQPKMRGERREKEAKEVRLVRQRPGWTLAASMAEPAAVSRCKASWTEQ